MSKESRQKAGVLIAAVGVSVGLVSVEPMAWGLGAVVIAPLLIVIGVALATPPIASDEAAARARRRRARIEAQARSRAEGQHPRGADGRFV